VAAEVPAPVLPTAKPQNPSSVGGKSMLTMGTAGGTTSHGTLKQIQEEVSSQAVTERNAPQPFNEHDAIFERMIIIIPYKAPETVMQIEQSFERINMQKLGFDNVRYLNTKEFTEERDSEVNSTLCTSSIKIISDKGLMIGNTRCYITLRSDTKTAFT